MIFLSRLKYRRNSLTLLLSNISFHCHSYVHFYIFIIVLFIASLISYHQPFGLLFNLKYIVPERPSIVPVRDNLINKQKDEQKQAYEWLENLLKNSQNYSNIISNQTHQSRFYDFLHIKANISSLSSYNLFSQPKQISLNNNIELDDQIIISILYSQQDTDHYQGKFYVGQVLYYLLKHHHSRFIITLCENKNTNEKISNDIQLIRHLVPVFILNQMNSNSTIDIYEQEKQAHLQCILANFQSFSNVNYVLLLQDDAQPIGEDFYNRFLSLIDNRIKQQWPINGQRQQPAFLKIYHPRWLIDYLHPSLYIIVQLIATSLFLTFICFACFHLFQMIIQDSTKSCNNHISNINQFWWQHYVTLSLSNKIMFVNRFIAIHLNLFYFLYYFLLITLVLILLNHSNVSWTWRSLHSSFYAIYPAPSCCLPGVLYFRQTYVQIVDYLNHIKCHHGYAIDTAFDDLPKRTHLQTYLVEPNLVHHIGLYSRLRHMYINPYLLD